MKKNLKLFAMMAIIGMICTFAACNKEDSKDNGGNKPPNGEDTTVVVKPKTVVNITFDGVANTDVIKYSAAYQDTNYRLMFGIDNTVQSFTGAVKYNGNVPMLYISTDKEIKSTYNNGEFTADYKLSSTLKDQQYTCSSRAKLIIDSITGNNTLISGSFTMYMLATNETENEKQLTGKFINVPLTKK